MPTVLCSSSPIPENEFLFKAVHTTYLAEDICKSIWALSSKVLCQDAYLELTQLTSDLIGIYECQNRLNKNPFASVRERKLSLPFEAVYKELKDSTCLVTGGLGCVGSILVKELLEFKPKKIIVIDWNAPINKSVDETEIVTVQCDIRDIDRVHEIFSAYSPDFVFHTAAQRDPGYAETHVAETTSVNVQGTFNIMQACEKVGTVKQMVFASTGKASRYYTEEVYAATKKVGEFIIDAIASESDIKYSIVRFTHLIDNSLMNIELQESSEQAAYLSVHSPGKYVTAQNATEAVFLMLNALVYSEEKQSNLLMVRNLDWPVESLEVALYYVKQSERSIPIAFVGNPTGYSEKFFRGQMDWSNPAELNLLTNVYERSYRRLNANEDIIITRPCATNKNLIESTIENIKGARGEMETKKRLTDGLKELVKASLKKVDKKDTADILRWGLDPTFLELEHLSVANFNSTISLLVDSLAGSEYDLIIEDQPDNLIEDAIH